MAYGEQLSTQKTLLKAKLPISSAALNETSTFESYTMEEPMDVLGQLHSNLERLEDLQGHLSFMMVELQGLIRKMK